MYQLAALVFIAVAGAGAGYLAQRPTIASNEGLALVVHEMSTYKDLEDVTITCDDNVPIGAEGARFACSVTNHHGDVDHLACTIYRTGSIACPADKTERSHSAPKSGDTWE